MSVLDATLSAPYARRMQKTVPPLSASTELIVPDGAFPLLTIHETGAVEVIGDANRLGVELGLLTDREAASFSSRTRFFDARDRELACTDLRLIGSVGILDRWKAPWRRKPRAIQRIAFTVVQPVVDIRVVAAGLGRIFRKDDSFWGENYDVDVLIRGIEHASTVTELIAAIDAAEL